MSDGDVVTQDARSLAVERVYTAVVLNVCTVSYPDVVYVPAYDGIEPYGAVVSHLYVAGNDGSFGKIAMLAEMWCRYSCQFLYSCHICKFYGKGSAFCLKRNIFVMQTYYKMSISEKIQAVRQWMNENEVGALIVPTDDPHGSEYVAGHWQCRRWLTGFTGSAGDAVVTMDEALLWTDSRYWLQAEEQLAGTEFRLMREGCDKDISEWLEEHGLVNTEENPDCVVRSYEKPFDVIWKDRPPLPLTKAWILPDGQTGESAGSKLRRIEDWLRMTGIDSLLISDLSEVAWVLNIRGGDIEYNPVVISFLQLRADGSRTMYVHESQIAGIKDYLLSLGITFAPYEQGLSVSEAQRGKVSSPVTDWKSVKNPVEQEGFRSAHIRDGVAMVRFLSWLDCAGATSELGVEDRLKSFRAGQPGFLDLSFGTIAGYGPHGAIVHYEASPETDSVIEGNGLLLLDSGAHYCFVADDGSPGFSGTTDITRTIAIGKPADYERYIYTLVLKGHLQLQNAVFPRGTTALQLDVLARASMWKSGYDYGHGTGHGVGHVLGVHEGPVQIRKNHRTDTVRPVVEGCVITDEPGIYVPGKFGVRIENVLLCVAGDTTGFGDFLKFEPLTMCPYERKLIDKDMLTPEEVDWIDCYHGKVRDVILPLLDEEKDRDWLIQATARL